MLTLAAIGLVPLTSRGEQDMCGDHKEEASFQGILLNRIHEIALHGDLEDMDFTNSIFRGSEFRRDYSVNEEKTEKITYRTDIVCDSIKLTVRATLVKKVINGAKKVRSAEILFRGTFGDLTRDDVVEAFRPDMLTNPQFGSRYVPGLDFVMKAKWGDPRSQWQVPSQWVALTLEKDYSHIMALDIEQHEVLQQ